MKVLSIMTVDPASLKPPTEEDMQRMGELIIEFKSNGWLIDTGGIMPGQLSLKMSRKGSNYTVTDGPFAEAKEVVAGFALLEVSGRDQAVALTRRFLEYIGDATCELHEIELA